MARIVIDLGKPGGGKKIAKHFEAEIASAMGMAVVECMRQLTISTPVDTGRARWGWYCSTGTPSNETPPPGQYSFPDVTARVDEMGTYTVTDTLYIANNVPYIVRLNAGYSKQAPARFVERAAANAQNAVIRYLKTR